MYEFETANPRFFHIIVEKAALFFLNFLFLILKKKAALKDHHAGPFVGKA